MGILAAILHFQHTSGIMPTSTALNKIQKALGIDHRVPKSSELERANAKLGNLLRIERSLNTKLSEYSRVRAQMKLSRRVATELNREAERLKALASEYDGAANQFNNTTKGMLKKSSERIRRAWRSRDVGKMNRAAKVEGEVAKATKSRRLDSQLNQMRGESKAAARNERKLEGSRSRGQRRSESLRSRGQRKSRRGYY